MFTLHVGHIEISSISVYEYITSINHGRHLNCLKTFTIIDNLIMDIAVYISLCTCIRVNFSI